MRLFILSLICIFPLFLFAQKSTKDLEAALKKEQSSKDRMTLEIELAKRYISSNPKRAVELGKKGYQTAVKNKNHGRAAQASYNIALAYANIRKNKNNVDIWLRNCLQSAKLAHDSDLIIKSVVKRSRVAKRKGDYRKAYAIMEEAFDYFSKKGSSIADMEQEFEMQRMQISKEKRSLEREKKKLEKDIQILSGEKDQLSSEKTELTEKQKELLEANERAAEKINDKEEELATVEELKSKAEKRAYRNKKKAEKLSGENEIISEQLEMEQVQREMAEVKASRSNLMFLLSGVIALFFVILALALYGRFRAKKKANLALEEERQRSDDLLLNILPANIADELKTTGTASAKKYNHVSVMLVDFKDFTKISKTLTPEQLVKELDHCFKGFDHIISHYPIEKIKTIGDAYMCASGLTEEKIGPKDMVKAALEMQEFLKEYKAERSRIGLSSFEARIGIHTGPVVAGVVGTKKFAYDIWGETVNIASRLEHNCDVGRVNVSKTIYEEIRYLFDVEARGKIDAKNLGSIDMYHVNRILEKNQYSS
ncbi:MAG: adenylate/guanylate cyclase domain-containing protein [Saprospiraceae bacterium]